MSLNTLAVQRDDVALADRVESCANREAWQPGLADDPFADSIRNGYLGVISYFIWPVCVATEAEYASALAAAHPNPGGDEAVISDQMILSAVQMAWPEPPEPPAP